MSQYHDISGECVGIQAFGFEVKMSNGWYMFMIFRVATCEQK